MKGFRFCIYFFSFSILLNVVIEIDVSAKMLVMNSLDCVDMSLFIMIGCHYCSVRLLGCI